jgi:uncharacterized protein YbcC (UPF0753/DUF2309 family)
MRLRLTTKQRQRIALPALRMPTAHVEEVRGELVGLLREQKTAQVLREVDIQLTDMKARAATPLLREMAGLRKKMKRIAGLFKAYRREPD